MKNLKKRKKNMKKTINKGILVFSLLIVSFCAIAQKETIEGTGNVKLTDHMTRYEAEKIALEKAQQDANNKLGSIVESETISSRIQVNNDFSESYSHFSKVFSHSKLVLKKAETQQSFNTNTKEITITVKAVFEFNQDDYINEVNNFFSKKNTEISTQAINARRNYMEKMSQIEEKIKSGNLDGLSKLIDEKNATLFEADKAFYVGSRANTKIAEIVGMQIGQIDFFRNR